MADITSISHHPLPAAPAGDGLAYWLCFAFVLLVALVGQALFLHWRDWFPGAESERSLWKGVRAGVCTFMSHLN